MTGHDTSVSITERLFAVAERDGGRELVVDPMFGRFSYAQVAEQVERLAHGLRVHGIGPGDVVILQLPNWAPFLVCHLALSALGAVTAIIPLVYREHELRQVLALTSAKCLVVPAAFRGFDFAAMAERLRGEAQALKHVLLVGGDGASRGSGMLSYQDLLAHPWEASAAGLAASGPDDLTALGFTSGTTGDIKAAMFSDRVLAATNRGLADRYDLNEDDRLFGCSPLGHAVGFTHAARMALTTGARLVLLERWEPDRALPLIEQERCTFMACATPFLMDLVYHPALRHHGSLASVRVFLCGGATVPERLLRDARAALTHTFTSPLWGMTECGGVTTCPLDAPEEKLFQSDGLPCGGMELKVVDSAGKALPPGEEGELMARGPMVTLGYYRRPDLTAECYLPDGFFRTGDRARMDADGYVKITGRSKDIIIRGGVNISPSEIEAVLFASKRIANAAVVGMPDERLGERICAFVVLAEGRRLDVAEVQRWMAEAGLAKQKWPERIEVVSEFPMTPSGKIQKFRLRETIAARLATETEAAVASEVAQ